MCVRRQEGMEELAPLSSEQQQIADRVLAGHSVFFTGCAGQCFSPPGQILTSTIQQKLIFTFTAATSMYIACMHTTP